MGDQVRVKREPHLNEPHSMENQPHAANDFGKVRILGGLQVENRGNHANSDGDEQEIEVMILDSALVLSLEVIQQKLFDESEKKDRIEK